MNILATQYSPATKSFEIYLAGCSGPHCKGCHNPDSWDFCMGDPYQDHLELIVEKVKSFSAVIDYIWILGGEPLDQPKDHLRGLLMYLTHTTEKPLWLWTRNELEDVPEDILEYLDAVKTGRFDESAGPGTIQCGIQLATGNQKINFL